MFGRQTMLRQSMLRVVPGEVSLKPPSLAPLAYGDNRSLSGLFGQCRYCTCPEEWMGLTEYPPTPTHIPPRFRPLPPGGMDRSYGGTGTTRPTPGGYRVGDTRGTYLLRV